MNGQEEVCQSLCCETCLPCVFISTYPRYNGNELRFCIFNSEPQEGRTHITSHNLKELKPMRTPYGYEEVTEEKGRMSRKCWVSRAHLRPAEKQSLDPELRLEWVALQSYVSNRSYGGERPDVKKM
jgi:hypothetical protein